MQNFSKESVALNSQKLRHEFEALAFPWIDRLYNTALRLTRDQLDAEDLVQDTYVSAWRFFHRFKPGTNFRSWIFCILFNNFINEYRKKQRQPCKSDFEKTCASFAIEDTSEMAHYKEADLNANYDELFDDSISAALDKLPEHYRIVVLLADVNDLKYKEIAKILNCPIGTVMSRLSRGRHMLVKFLNRYAFENGYVSS